MASHQHYQQENLPVYHTSKPAPLPTSIQQRNPLSSLPTNAPSPRKPQQLAGQKRAHPNDHTRGPAKRSISILDSEKGFTYLSKRRRTSIDSSPDPLATQDGLYAEITPPLPTTDPKHPASKPHSRHASQSKTPARKISSAAQELAEQSSEDESEDSRDGSQHSFTSLINYDPSSQTSGVTPKVGYPAHTPLSQRSHGFRPMGQGQGQGQDKGLLSPFVVPSSQQRGNRVHARPQKGQTRHVHATRAETLRLRLRVAVYKVLTGQTYVPFTRLRAFRAPEGMGRTVGLGLDGIQDEDQPGRRGNEEVFRMAKERQAGPGEVRRESSGEETIVGDV
ncbi:Hypothetical protein D9617_8g049500 [Elsinoe fawcettii]|nr:Hypothetical protein D9617_8g049500 [Elsinoe fawcettii]